MDSDVLDVLQECGFGNWIDVARRMQGKTPGECKNHYMKNFIDYQNLPGLPKIKETRTSLFPPEIVLYDFKLQDIKEQIIIFQVFLLDFSSFWAKKMQI